MVESKNKSDGNNRSQHTSRFAGFADREIANWDGKSLDEIRAVYDRYCQEPVFGSELVQLLDQPPLQTGASWLLKRYLEEDGTLELEDANQIFRSLPDLKEWESKLHVLQCLPYLTIGKRDVKLLETFLRVCLAGENKFVRAWAYNGFYELALQYPKYQAEVDQLLEQALEDEAASVKARVRNIMKLRF